MKKATPHLERIIKEHPEGPAHLWVGPRINSTAAQGSPPSCTQCGTDSRGFGTRPWRSRLLLTPFLEQSPLGFKPAFAWSGGISKTNDRAKEKQKQNCPQLSSGSPLRIQAGGEIPAPLFAHCASHLTSLDLSFFIYKMEFHGGGLKD